MAATAGSTKDAASGGMRASPRKSKDGSAWELSLTVPAKLAPVWLAFEIQSSSGREVSRHGQRFALPVGMSAGSVQPLGVPF